MRTTNSFGARNKEKRIGDRLVKTKKNKQNLYFSPFLNNGIGHYPSENRVLPRQMESSPPQHFRQENSFCPDFYLPNGNEMRTQPFRMIARMGGVVASAAIISLLGLPALSSGATEAKSAQAIAPGTYTTGYWTIATTTGTVVATATMGEVRVSALLTKFPKSTSHTVNTQDSVSLIRGTVTPTNPAYYPVAPTTAAGLDVETDCSITNVSVKKALTPLTQTCAKVTYTLSEPVSNVSFAGLSQVHIMGGTTGANLKVDDVEYQTATITSNFKFGHSSTKQSAHTKFSNTTRTIEPATLPALGSAFETTYPGTKCAKLKTCYNAKILSSGPVTSFSITYTSYVYFATRCATYTNWGTSTSSARCATVTPSSLSTNTWGTNATATLSNTTEISFTVYSGGNYGGTNVAATPTGGGFYIANSNGTVTPHGTAPAVPELSTLHVNVSDITGIALDTCNTAGYWLVGADGGVFSLGITGFYGSLPLLHVDPVDPILAIATTNDCGGYWEVAKDGGIFAFGDATFFGSLPYTDIHATNIVGFAPTPDSGGYLIIGSDGGTFNFGDAKWFGSIDSVGAYANNIVGGTWADTGGYYLVGSNGGVYAFGDAAFKGSLGATNISVPIIGIIRGTGGYKLINSAGTVYTFPVA